MMIQRENKEYLINSKLKVLEGLKSRKTNGDVEVLESMEDLDAQISALTSFLETI